METQLQAQREAELDKEYPHRPKNHSPTLPFHTLFDTLFNPLNENRKKTYAPRAPQRKFEKISRKSQNPNDVRYGIINRFISRWRKEVGNDIYPAFRLVLPDKDRERPMYGLKESVIGKLLIRVLKINKDAEDGQLLRNWKQPGQSSVGLMAGDFAKRCFEIIVKRPMRTTVGEMSITEVNDLLDRLAVTSGQDEQTKILTKFYEKMNPEELMWLIRIILRQMKIGASEKTIFNVWHPDADNLFNVSSSLRRVCWELSDLNIRLEQDEREVALMQCFQPQLAQFQMHSLQRVVDRMRPTADDPSFWIEEKLDGERMQLHMRRDQAGADTAEFKFWSRKAKDYTYLYGSAFDDETSALTSHLRGAFNKGVQSMVLDGEMITWDMQEDAIAPFGTLKTAAKEQQADPNASGPRPLYKVFDILYLNGQNLTKYTMRDRRNALQKAVTNVYRRLEFHEFVEATSVSMIEKMLRKIVANASEGLVVKNPRSAYRLNSRHDDWMKVKPEYMMEYGENLDCIIIGGYYGSGHRGGRLSSFLCGLRVDGASTTESSAQFFSFFKVGGGFTGSDYAAIRHKTEGKWHNWDARHPPAHVLLAGGDRQFERPDQWIAAADSVVVEVKAAQTASSDQFRLGTTLRFPRFKRLRDDRKWDDALSISDFMALKAEAEKKNKETQFRVDDAKKKQRAGKSKKRPLTLVGAEEFSPHSATSAPASTPAIFHGRSFFVTSGTSEPVKRSKGELERVIRDHGGQIFQTAKKQDITCIGNSRTVQVASMMKGGAHDIVKSLWVEDNIAACQKEGQSGLVLTALPMEPRHYFFARPEMQRIASENVDAYGDSFFREPRMAELRKLVDGMIVQESDTLPKMEDQPGFSDLVEQIQNHRGWLFRRVTLHVPDKIRSSAMQSGPESLRVRAALRLVKFGGGTVWDELHEGVTHVLSDESGSAQLVDTRELRHRASSLNRQPRFVGLKWVEMCWKEQTLLDEERSYD